MRRTRWRKLGRIFCPTGNAEWMRTHAAVPIAESIGGDLFRIFFSSRDSLNRSHTGFVIIDITKPQQVLSVSSTPVLAPGLLGTFDDSGAMATWITKVAGSSFLYYVGWNLGITVPFRNAIGLAIGDAERGYVRLSEGPIVDRSAEEPHFCASCCVLEHGGLWRMWYLSCTRWSIYEGGPRHHYHIKYAESDDGIRWRRLGRVAIDFSNDAEYAISRPSVIRDPDAWRMWYSYRGDAYRIGFAESEDGLNWTRRDSQGGLDVSSSGWDSRMVEYPFVFDHRGQRYMVYNGDGYGLTGFGLAVLS
jgi:hypothetical protein